MTGTHQVLHENDVTAELPLDRGPYEHLVAAVLAWTVGVDALPSRDCEQLALQLTGHAHEVASDVRRPAEALPRSSGRRALADLVLAEADQALGAPLEGTVRCVQQRAQVVRSLYARLDRLTGTYSETPMTVPPP
ncbi:restriction endonuclease [Streptomyces anulatus]|uniref:restriction endonuclease n=1 Tax=Streptomyces anulatus TaxID=1892 RepID=UPI003870180D|nr:restriction endonuclease [Streptomyces anulatus]